jgi:hypothetical protein
MFGIKLSITKCHFPRCHCENVVCSESFYFVSFSQSSFCWVSPHPLFCCNDFHFKKALYQALFCLVILLCVIQLIVILLSVTAPFILLQWFSFQKGIIPSFVLCSHVTLCLSANCHFAKCHSTLHFAAMIFISKKQYTKLCLMQSHVTFCLSANRHFADCHSALHFATMIFISNGHYAKIWFAQSFYFVSSS